MVLRRRRLPVLCRLVHVLQVERRKCLAARPLEAGASRRHPTWIGRQEACNIGIGENVKGVEGLSALEENEEEVASVKALFSEVALWAFVCLYPPASEKSIKFPMASLSSSLRFAERGDGDGCTRGEDGEMALVGWEVVRAGELRTLSGMLVSEARRISFAGVMPFFCMNFSNTSGFRGLLPIVSANSFAFS